MARALSRAPFVYASPSVLCLAALTLAGAWLRVGRIDAVPMSADEAFSWRIARLPLGAMSKQLSLDTPPPLHFIVERIWISEFGDSLRSLRLLAAIPGIVSVPLVYLLVSPGRQFATARLALPSAGALAACAVMACHSFEVTQSRIARMYSLGILLTGVSTWLLLRAADPRRRRAWGWCCGYGLSAACLCLCHHFALLTILAQMVAAAWAGASLIRCHRRSVPRLLRRAALAGAVGLSVYSIWLPTTFAQCRRVHQDFWVKGDTPSELLSIVFRWWLGCDVEAIAVAPLAAAAAALLVYGAVAPRIGARLFWLMAVLPWLATLVIVAVSGRPLVQERYFAFAHLPIVCLFGSAIDAIPSLRGRIATAIAGFLLCAHSTADSVLSRQSAPDELECVVVHLSANYRRGDVIVLRRASTLHRLRYALRGSPDGAIEMKVPLELSANGGHVNHVAALMDDEILIDESQLDTSGARRLWEVREGGVGLRNLGAAWRSEYEHPVGTSTPRAGEFYSVVLYQKSPPLPHALHAQSLLEPQAVP